MRFVGVDSMRAWISDTGTERIIAGLMDALERDFRRWTEFERAPRVASHSPLGVIELMPTSDGERYAFKYVNGHPGNPARGLQTVTAFGVLADVFTGYPLLLAEMTLLTALRTAATSGLAARWLAPERADVAALIGAGSQCEFQALALRAAVGTEAVRVFDIDPAASGKAARNLSALGFDVLVASSAAEAVEGAAVVTTCTADKRRSIALGLEHVRAGVHLNAIGGDCPGKTELDPRILESADVFVEHTPQTRIEGELQNVAADFPVTELWEVIAGTAPGRTSAAQITLFDSVGFAVEDFTALAYLAEQTAGTRYSEDLRLIAEPDDPRDLFGMVGSPVPAL